MATSTFPPMEPAAGVETRLEPSSRGELRSSCDLCYTSKVRCPREKPTCARCDKIGVRCTYSPTKRPGRPRRPRRRAPSEAATTAAKRKPSATYAPYVSSNQGLDQPLGDESSTTPPLPSYDPVIFPAFDLSYAPSVQSSADIAGGLWDKVLRDTSLEVSINPGLETAGVPPGAATNAELLPSELPLTPLTNESIPLLPDDPIIRTSIEDVWSARMEWTREEDAIVVDSSGGPASSSGERQTSPGASTPSPLGFDQFIEQCKMVRHLTSSTTGPLTLLASQADIGMDQTPDTTTTSSSSSSVSTNMQCLCHVALFNLLCYRHKLGQLRPERLLETCLHVQRILHWTSTLHRECLICRDDMVAILNVTCIARQIAQVYCSIIAGQVQERYSQGNRPACSSSPIESTRLSLGSKVIQGPSKLNALSRLIGLKLRQMRDLLQGFQTSMCREPMSEITESIQLVITGALERISVAMGVLSTLK
ncbi:Zn(II)2Cys6 transcription factor domain-containing protein [Aspergillus novofumigatus IBT 16806]|uniref:Zn(2)-C6 fungal-type domain-containing protein n=1 Tax=Aspergillus novofumigatus (strain IBT 16806) TaxID=1392255 RepID=A0A2I1CJE7_ASPN1|nr:uncharacterized protein P174DRAFT_429148 [Aspergillus novofumigatus IBT 16806]PKX97736.1 hypothetical protein P174DRAFT_429148 [Aspergillus novofumigatus IBT 16806]